jgi:outer membrane biosynthesis protein TonB
MRELVSMEGALHDEVAIKDATSHLKDVLLAKALEEKLASRKALDQLELDGSRVNDVLNDKKQREKEDKERARSLRLESIRLRNWKKADALGGGVVNAAPPLVVLKQTPDLPTISIAESPMMMPNKPQPTLETAPPNVNEVKVQVKRPVVKKSVEEMIWEAELARRKKDAEEAKAQQERRRKEEQKTAAFVAARARLAQGSFMWHNGKFGFYDNAKSAVTAVASDPSSWTQYQDDSGNIYYYNSITGVSQYEYPH